MAEGSGLNIGTSRTKSHSLSQLSPLHFRHGWLGFPGLVSSFRFPWKPGLFHQHSRAICPSLLHLKQVLLFLPELFW